MLLKSIVPALFLAIAASAEVQARHRPYQLARMPARSLFGLMRRDDGYHPETEVCGEGDSCAEACGAGYEQCPSNDSTNHCYNPNSGDTCCQSASGNACDAGFYCARDSKANTVCCPENMDAVECAVAVKADGPVTPDAQFSVTVITPSNEPTPPPPPPPTTTSTSTSTPTSTPEAETVPVTTSSTTLTSISSTVFFSTSSFTTSSSSSTLTSATTTTTTSSSTDSTSVPTSAIVPATAAGTKAALVLAIGFFVALL